MAKRKYESKIALQTKNFIDIKENAPEEAQDAAPLIKTDEKDLTKDASAKADVNEKAKAPEKKKEVPVRKQEKPMQAAIEQQKAREEETAEPEAEKAPLVEPVAAAAIEKPARNITKKLGRKKIRKDGDKQLSLFVDEDVYEWIIANLKYGDTMGAYVNGILRKAMEAER